MDFLQNNLHFNISNLEEIRSFSSIERKICITALNELILKNFNDHYKHARIIKILCKYHKEYSEIYEDVYGTKFLEKKDITRYQANEYLFNLHHLIYYLILEGVFDLQTYMRYFLISTTNVSNLICRMYCFLLNFLRLQYRLHDCNEALHKRGFKLVQIEILFSKIEKKNCHYVIPEIDFD